MSKKNKNKVPPNLKNSIVLIRKEIRVEKTIAFENVSFY